MANRSEIEQSIVDAVNQMGYFQNMSADLIRQPVMSQFVDAGFALLQHYQTTDDTQVNDDIVGAFVDCAMITHQLADNASLSDADRRVAHETTIGLEDLVNAITRAVEKNIHNNR